jgi:glycosyltransferase involved in cell wall biosynthesis
MRIVIPSIQVPFITGGANLMTEGLAAALRRAGHEAEIVSVPFKFFPESYIAHVMDFWCEQDFSNFSGVPVDKVVALQFPAYYVKHESKIVWLMHQHRAVYELYDDHRASGDLKSLREKIHRADSAHLSGVKKIFSMSETISRRLRTYNSVDAVHLYHPPYA